MVCCIRSTIYGISWYILCAHSFIHNAVGPMLVKSLIEVPRSYSQQVASTYPFDLRAPRNPRQPTHHKQWKSALGAGPRGDYCACSLGELVDGLAAYSGVMPPGQGPTSTGTVRLPVASASLPTQESEGGPLHVSSFRDPPL